MSELFQFDEATHSYLFGERRERVPSVTQILNAVGIVDYSYIPSEILAAAADRGTRAHKAAEFLLQDDLDWSTVSDDIFGFVSSIEKFLNETGFKADPEMIERQGIHTIQGMRFGYRWDATGVLNMHNVLIDFKFTSQKQKHWGVQLAPYEMAARAVDGKVRKRVVVHGNKLGGYQLVPCDDLNDYRVFQWALGVESWKQLQKGKEYGNECPSDLAE